METAARSVVIASTDSAEASRVARALGDGFSVKRVEPQDVRSAVADGYDVVLADAEVCGAVAASLASDSETVAPALSLVVLCGAADGARDGRPDCVDTRDLSNLRFVVEQELAMAGLRAREHELGREYQRLLERTVEDARLFEVLHQFALETSGELSVERLAALTAVAGEAIFGDVEIGVALLDPTGETARLVTATRSGAAPGRVVPMAGTVAGAAIRGMQPVAVEEYRRWPDAAEAAIAAGLKSALAVPLLANGGAIGSLSVHTYEPRSFSERDVELAVALAAQVAPAIEAARVHEDVKRRAAKQELVADLGRIAVQGGDDERLAQVAVQELAQILTADGCALLTMDVSGLVAAAGHGSLAGFEAAGVETAPADIGSAADDVWLEGLIARAGCRAAGIHVEFQGRPGILVVARSDGRPFSAADRHLLGGVASILTECSRTAAAERHLRQSEERYRALVESVLEGVWHLDLEGRTQYANAPMAHMLQVDPAELIGRSIWDFVARPDARRLKRVLRAGGAGSGGRFDQLLTTSSGSVVEASMAVSPVRDSTRAISGVVCLVTDLADRREAERALRESEEKSRFLAGMSHELRTPLNSILGFAQLLGDPAFGPLTERQRRYLGHVETQGRHLLELINDVLDLSRVATGRVEFVEENVDLAVVARDVAARMQPLVEQKAQSLNVDVAAHVVARGDRLRVTQAVLNLASNAVKFTPAGGRVSICVEDAGGACAITVEDTGPGIPVEDQPRVFDEFSKLSSGRRGEGTGLGLALTRRLVQAMGGSVSLTSEPGRGSAFRIELPAAAPVAVAAARRPSVETEACPTQEKA